MAIWQNVSNIFSNEVIILVHYIVFVYSLVHFLQFLIKEHILWLFFHRDSSYPSGAAFHSYLIFLSMILA